MIMAANEDFLAWDFLRERLTQLLAAVADDDFTRVRQLLRELVSGYSPQGEIVDWVYLQRRQGCWTDRAAANAARLPAMAA